MTDDTAAGWGPVDLKPFWDDDGTDRPSVGARTDGVCLFYPGKVHSVAGEPESGKSWLVQQVCADETRGGRRVLYLDFEDSPRGVAGRLRELGLDLGTVLDRFAYVAPTAGLDEAAWTVLHEHLDDTEPSLVVVDGVTEALSLLGLDDSNPDVAQFLMFLVRPLARTGAAVVQIDHLAKNAEKHNRYARGGGHKLAGVSGAAYLVETVTPFGRGRDGLSRVVIAKDRPGWVREHLDGDDRTIAELRMSSTGDAVTVEVCPPRAPGAFRPTTLMARVSEFLAGCTTPQSGRAVERGVAGRTVHVRQAVKRLVVEGYVAVTSGARGPLYELTSPFEEDCR